MDNGLLSPQLFKLNQWCRK